MKFKLIIAVILSALYLQGCTTNTTSMFGDDRSQLMLISEEKLNQEAKESYDQVLAQAKAQKTLNADKKFYSRVKKISDRLIKVAPELRADCKGWNWEVNTIKESTVNAWCMPGGKIVVYTGLNDTLKLNDNELAAVIGHEISHAIKEHLREQRSQAELQSSATKLASLLGVKKSITNTANVAYQAAFAMPFSRDQESESDKLGLELMYKANFDPNGAVTVMEKMNQFEKKAQAESGDKPNAASAFLNRITSSHPASEDRANDLKELIQKHGLKAEVK